MSWRTAAICLAAVKQEGKALRYVPYDLRTLSICSAAVKQDEQSMYHVPVKLRAEMPA